MDYNDLIGKTAENKYMNYVVTGWCLDSNGCPKTYGRGYNESFIDVTTYTN